MVSILVFLWIKVLVANFNWSGFLQPDVHISFIYRVEISKYPTVELLVKNRPISFSKMGTVFDIFETFIF